MITYLKPNLREVTGSSGAAGSPITSNSTQVTATHLRVVRDEAGSTGAAGVGMGKAGDAFGVVHLDIRGVQKK